MFKTRRLNNIFAADSRSVSLALDGFGFTDKTAGVDIAAQTVPEMAEIGLDNVLVTYGQAKNFTECFCGVGMTLRVDTTTSVFDPSVPDNAPMFDISDALKVGADAVVMMNFPGAANERATNAFAADLAREGNTWGMPLMAETLPYGYPVTTPESNDAHHIAAGARFSEELGADIIKTRFTGEDADREIIENVTIPVLALGGPKTDHESYFAFVAHCIKVGASGVAVGRNITQDPKPLAMVAALVALVHEDASAADAMRIYNER